MSDAMIPMFCNSLGQEELEAVGEVFASRWLGQGKQCSTLEEELAKHWGAPPVLLLNNGTAGLYIAMRALGIGAGDEVIVSTINFVACASAVIDCRATPIFADVDSRSLNILPDEIRRLRTPRTRAVVVLHYGGHPCPMDSIREACGDDILIIEDSANAVDSTYHGRHCGTIGDAGVFSFDAMKILVMGDGGALVVQDPEVRKRARCLRYLGLTERSTSGLDAFNQQDSKWWEYDLETTSGRFISNDILAAIGRVQLRKLPQFVERRRQIWRFYQSQFDDIPGLKLPPDPAPGCTSSCYLYWVQVGEYRDALASWLAQRGVYTTFRYHPLHLVGHFGSSESLPNAELVSRTTLNLPLHHNLTDDQAAYIADEVRAFMMCPAEI